MGGGFRVCVRRLGEVEFRAFLCVGVLGLMKRNYNIIDFIIKGLSQNYIDSRGRGYSHPKR